MAKIRTAIWAAVVGSAMALALLLCAGEVWRLSNLKSLTGGALWSVGSILLCGVGQKQLDEWSAAVKAGRSPDFGSNCISCLPFP